jgi:hypothetical protein
MNILNTKAGGYAAMVLVGGVLIYFVAKKFSGAVGDAARAVGEAVNPTSDKNLAYRGVNAVGEALTGDTDFNLGGWIYDLTHKDYDPNAPFVPRSVQVKEEASFFERMLGK